MSVDRHRHTYESNNWNDKDLSKRQEFGAMESDDTDNDRFIDKNARFKRKWDFMF